MRRGSFVGQALGNAFVHIVFGLADLVADVLKGGSLVEIMDGKNRTKHAFKTDIRAHARRNIGLQKFVVRIELKA